MRETTQASEEGREKKQEQGKLSESAGQALTSGRCVSLKVGRGGRCSADDGFRGAAREKLDLRPGRGGAQGLQTPPFAPD